MTPPVALTFWSFRLAVVAGLCMALLAWLTLWRARRIHYDPGALSVAWRHLLIVMSFSGWVMLLAGLAHVLVGAFPYMVNGTITVSEVAGNAYLDRKSTRLNSSH